MSKPTFTAEEKRELVLEYLALPYGSRGRWIESRALNRRTFHRWRQQMMVGLLERDMTVRGGVLVAVDENKEIARLSAQNQALQAQLEQARQRSDSQEKVIFALGKAIELLQDGTADKSEQPGPGRP